MSLLIWGLLTLGLGGYLTFYSLRAFRRNARYEFENRQAGGAVAFKSFDDSARHEMMKRRAKLTGNAGVIAIIIGIVMTIGGGVAAGTPKACRTGNPDRPACREARNAQEIYYDDTAPAACRMRPKSDLCRRALRERGLTPNDFRGRRPQ